jgi:chemotaxis protein MotB
MPSAVFDREDGASRSRHSTSWLGLAETGETRQEGMPPAMNSSSTPSSASARVRARLVAVTLAAIGASAFLGGCNNAQKDELAMLRDENSQLSMQRDEARSALESSEAERRRLEQENAGLQGQLAEMPPAAPTTTAQAGQGLDLPEGVTAENRNGQLVLTIEGDVLFDSGRTSLKDAAKRTLDKVVGEIRGTYPNAQLRLVGFTDSDPIRKSGFKSNYHLGFERAYTVGQFLVGKGIDKSRIEYASWGPELPRTTKKESRRVEIAIVND